jgi:glucosamine-6-phosphate deaminase
MEEVPRHCLTQGLGTIMDAHNIILVATGQAKAHAISQIVEGPVTAMYPGSVLQFHPHATIVVDEDAAAELTLADYYRETYANLPEWQRLDV